MSNKQVSNGSGQPSTVPSSDTLQSLSARIQRKMEQNEVLAKAVQSLWEKNASDDERRALGPHPSAYEIIAQLNASASPFTADQLRTAFETIEDDCGEPSNGSSGDRSNSQ